MIFKDRTEAGRILAKELSKTVDILEREKESRIVKESKGKAEKTKKDIIVLAIPNGGVAVGYEVSKLLNIDFDVIICRKVQVPWNPEAGYGSVAPDGSCFLNKKLILVLGLSDRTIKQNIQKTMNQIKKRIEKYRGKEPFPELKGKTVILVDDGLASGFTMLASIEFVKKNKPKKIIVAVPTASGSAFQLVKSEVDKLIALDVRYAYPFAVADVYKNWYDVSDEEVLEYLKKYTNF